MIDTRAVMRSLPLVASVLGRKYGVKVEIGGTDAYTDGTVIRLPSLPGDVPETLLAMARGYLDHEAGHVRDTDFQALKDASLMPIEKHVWNTLEDWRVEHKLASIFPGCRQNFDWLISHVFGTETEDEPAQPAAIILNWLLLEIRSWDVQALSSKRDILAGQLDTVFPGIRPKIGRVLTVVRTRCRSTQDAIDFAREIVRILDQYANSTEQPVSPNQDEPGDARFEPDARNTLERSERNAPGAQDEKSDQSEWGGEVQDDAPEGDGSHDGRDSSDDADASGAFPGREDQDQAKEHVRDLVGAGEDVLPQSLGDILADTLQATSRQSQEGAVTVAIPTEKSAAPLTETDILEARMASMALRTRMQGLLQTKILARASSGRRGRLDTGQLHRLAVSDPRLFRVKAERTGIDTTVHILLDCSGSMVRRIRLACCSCYAVASALEASKINVAVTAFPSSQLQNGSYSTVAPVITHGQKVHANLDLVPAGGTPMGEALWWVMQDMLPLGELRKLILVVTDGEPDSLECATQAIEQGCKAGFEIYGIGITSPGINVLLPGRSAVVNSMTELAPAMFTLLEGAILGC
ncbi:cobaltochelatase CobT-related protein [Desulfomicrobium escambiense]|uniref:cobaltochelatase CobT-related protein n=1 Tax=Desulfomicrobium escambiense TaxID=29503 RepID=UPI0003F707EE|nr:VWA domain-containing protein [Desulfomicrobium escambiense]